MLKEVSIYTISAKIAHTKEDSETYNTQVWNYNVLAEDYIEARDMVEEYLAGKNHGLNIYSVHAVYNNGSNLMLVDTECLLNRKQIDNTGKWVSVDERLPETEGDYLIYNSNSGRVQSCGYNGKGGWWTDYIVTHWMKLPQPPKEDI